MSKPFPTDAEVAAEQARISDAFRDWSEEWDGKVAVEPRPEGPSDRPEHEMVVDKTGDAAEDFNRRMDDARRG